MPAAHPLARLKLIALMFLLPLALALAGGWELHRVRSAGAGMDPQSPQVQARIAELQDMQRRVMQDFRTTLRVGDKTYAFEAARAHLQKEIDRLSGRSWAYQAAGPRVIAAFAVLSVASGLAGMVLGVAGLAWATHAGRVARRSREQLVRVFALSRRLLPFLVVGVGGCVVLALAGLTGAEGWRIVDKIASGARPAGETRLVVMLVVVGGMALCAAGAALFALRGAFAAFEVGPLQQHGRAVGPEQAPGLWRHVEGVARAVRARPPQHIVVGLTDGFYVTAHEVQVMPEGRTLTGQTLYVPLTQAALLRPDEFAAIIGHELGHFAGDDTEYTRRFVPLYAGMRASLDALEANGHWAMAPARLVGEYLLDEIAQARQHWSREREFAADAVGMHVAGSRASARALVRIAAVSALTDEFLFAAAQQPPQEVPDDLVDALVTHARQQGLALPDGALDHALPHPTDSHPPTAQRLKALGESIDAALAAEALAPVDPSGLAWLDSFFVDRHAVTKPLSHEFIAVPREAERAALQRIAEAGEPAADVHERTAPMVAVLAVCGLASLGLAVYLAARPTSLSADAFAMRVVALCVALGATVFGVLCWRYVQRGRRPVVQLTPTGLRAPGLAAEVPWQHVCEVTVSHGQGCLMEFRIELKAPQPHLAHRNLGRMRWKPKPRKLSIQFIGPRGMTPQALLEKVLRYGHADDARRRLAEF